MKSAKIVVAIGKKQDELWDAIFDAFGGIVAEPDEKPAEDIDARVKFFEQEYRMKVVYATAQGKTEAFVNRIGVKDPVKIGDGSEKINEDYILFTYTTGHGEVPAPVAAFVKNNASNIKAVIGVGNIPFHADTFAFAADNIAKQYNVPILYKIDGAGEEIDEKRVKLILNKWLMKQSDIYILITKGRIQTPAFFISVPAKFTV